MIIDDDMIEKICFIEVYGRDVVESIVTEYDCNVSWQTEPVKRRKPFNEPEFKKMRNNIVSIYENGLSGIITDYLSYTLAHTIPFGFVTGTSFAYTNKAIPNLNTEEWEMIWKLDMLDIYYKYPHEYTKIKENSLSELEWKLDAIRMYATTSEAKRNSILSENESKIEEFKAKREETIRQQKEAYAKFKKECEIIAEQNKIKERERKKALKEEAKRRMALEAKMENHEIYGEVIYKGKMYVIRSKSDLEHLLEHLS